MPEFISKLQHKNYETGEFSDEKARDLDETISLIKAFPWEDERHLTDIQLTGPSVTICNEAGECIKVSLYFNDKFIVYYLNKHKTVFERSYKSLDLACDVIAQFFNYTFKPEGFDKPLFNINNKKHFVTDQFEYTHNVYRFISVNIYLLMYFLMIPAVMLFVDGPIHFPPTLIIPLLAFMGIPGAVMFYTIIKTFPKRNQFLKISRGQDIFWFGETKDKAVKYNKSDIANITTYEATGNRNPVELIVYKIMFNDKTFIKFSNLLISSSSFFYKFPDSFNKFSDGNKHPLRLL